jgi:hypothetical protein
MQLFAHNTQTDRTVKILSKKFLTNQKNIRKHYFKSLVNELNVQNLQNIHLATVSTAIKIHLLSEGNKRI